MQPSITEEHQQIAWPPAHAIVPRLGRKKKTWWFNPRNDINRIQKTTCTMN